MWYQLPASPVGEVINQNISCIYVIKACSLQQCPKENSAEESKEEGKKKAIKIHSVSIRIECSP